MTRRLLVVIFVFLLLGVSISAATAQDSSSLWFGTFWSNTNLEGDPVARASSGEINFDWGDGSPTGVPSDYWSGQWRMDCGQAAVAVRTLHPCRH